jgi:cysteinyl-tRNA synthetase
VVKRIIGHGGGKMKDIVSRSGGDAKLRLRGKGSGYVERDLKVESTEPLQLCISCPRQDGYDIAVRGARELLEEVYEERRQWCADHDLPANTPSIHMSEKHHHTENGAGRNDRHRSRSPKRQKGKNKQRLPLHAVSDTPSDNTPAPPEAPSVEEIRRLIQDRNDARRRGDFKEADRIRDDLRDRKVVLSDERGKHGEAQHVTSWRYWTD